MKIVKFVLVYFFIFVFAAISIEAQSTSVEFPTPITTNNISGKIKARDIGDSRSTVYYYVFEARQGDVFLKIEASNLNGDIDIFYADNLRPLTKISLYADTLPTQTGREIYLRKSEKLILRVEGRTPNDDPATFSINFEGSFLAMAGSTEPEELKAPVVTGETETDVKVNSVGTIIEIKPTPTPTPKETVARIPRRNNPKTTTTPEAVSTITTPKRTSQQPKPKVETKTEPEKKVEVVVTDNLPPTEVAENPTPPVKETPKVVSKTKTTKKKPVTTKRKTTSKKETVKKETPKGEASEKENELALALENIRLIVEFKDGGKIERPMNEIIKFGVDKGVLTIVNKDGSIGRYSILNIVKISVE